MCVNRRDECSIQICEFKKLAGENNDAFFDKKMLVFLLFFDDTCCR